MTEQRLKVEAEILKRIEEIRPSNPQKSDYTHGIDVGLAMAKVAIKDAPTIEERKTGKWERHNTYHGDDVSGFVDPDWRCSECCGQANVNAWCMYDLTDFCPNCGADMRGKQNG